MISLSSVTIQKGERDGERWISKTESGAFAWSYVTVIIVFNVPVSSVVQLKYIYFNACMFSRHWRFRYYWNKMNLPLVHTGTNFETSSHYSSFHSQYTFSVTSDGLNESNRTFRTHHHEIYLLGNVARYYWDIYRRRLSDGLDTKSRAVKLLKFSKKFSVYFNICSSAWDNWINRWVSCRCTPS